MYTNVCWSGAPPHQEILLLSDQDSANQNDELVGFSSNLFIIYTDLSGIIYGKLPDSWWKIKSDGNIFPRMLSQGFGQWRYNWVSSGLGTVCFFPCFYGNQNHMFPQIDAGFCSCFTNQQSLAVRPEQRSGLWGERMEVAYQVPQQWQWIPIKKWRFSMVFNRRSMGKCPLPRHVDQVDHPGPTSFQDHPQ